MIMNGQPGETEDDPLEKAVKKLEDAEERLEHARADEGAAEHDVQDAIEAIKKAEHDHQVKVHVVHVNEVQKASFKEPEKATLQKVWDDSYGELEIAKKPKDVFQTGGDHPKSLMSHLGLSLEKAKKDGVITDHHFGIVSETGGA
jgi:hypothetical protein